MNRPSNILGLSPVICALILFLSGCVSTRQDQRQTRPAFAAPSPLTALSRSPYPTLKASIDSLVPDSLFPPAHIGLKIVSLKTRETLYELNPSFLFNPASNQKLFTAATALERLGKDFPLRTVADVDTVSGTIFIKGFGDPVFSLSDIDSLARLTAQALPPGRTWRVAGDISYFDNEYWGYGWNWDDEPESYQPFLTPLIVNSNCISLLVAPGRQAGEPALVRTEPPTDFVTIENRTTTVTDSVVHPLQLTRKRRSDANVFTADGDILAGSAEDSVFLSVVHPEQFVTNLFAARLRTQGVSVSETAIDTLTPTSFGVAQIAHTLDSVVTFMNKESDNLSAETLLKVIAAQTKGIPGSAGAGTAVVRELLAEHGVDTNSVSIVDGSGLSRMDLTSPAVIIQLLEAMYESPQFTSFYNSLPVAGVDGTNRNRMRGSSAQGNLRAKTGTLTAVTALSGYVQSADGEWLAFSMMMMNYPTGARPYRSVQDRIGILLSSLRRENF